MSNTLNSFEQSNLLSSVSKGSQTTGVPEIYGYNVISDQDHDILNQGSIEHIQKYFDNKQRESEAKASTVSNAIEDPTKQPSQNGTVSASTLGDNTFIAQRHVSPARKPSDYSVNSSIFIIKFVIFILFMWILWDFLNRK